jgi:hypothetical protein
MWIVRAFKRLFGLACVVLAPMLGLFALFSFFADNATGSRTIAAVIGGLALLVLVIGLRCLRRHKRNAKVLPRRANIPPVRQRTGLS